MIHLLLVEDDAQIREIVDDYFTAKSGGSMQVEMAGSGSENMSMGAGAGESDGAGLIQVDGVDDGEPYDGLGAPKPSGWGLYGEGSGERGVLSREDNETCTVLPVIGSEPVISTSSKSNEEFTSTKWGLPDTRMDLRMEVITTPLDWPCFWRDG